MTPESRDADLTARAIAVNARLRDALVELIGIVDALRNALSTPVEEALNAPSNAAEALA